MPRPGRPHQLMGTSLWPIRAWPLLQSLLLVVLLTLLNIKPVQAIPKWPFDGQAERGSRAGAPPIPPSTPSGNLQEVAPPGAVQQLRERLNQHHPQLKLESPTTGAVLKQENWELVLKIQDWPLAIDPELGLGAHVVVQIDEDQPIRISKQEGEKLRIAMKGLRPGSHRLTAYAAYPWGEAVKEPEASLQWRLHMLQPLTGTQPADDAPWLVTVSPSELSSGEPLLLDSLTWNAPLQNLKEGDGRWRLRVSINGDSFLMDHQEAVWLKGLPPGSSAVQLELLDGLGEPIEPVFNNQLKAVDQKAKARPIWMQAKLSDNELGRLLGEPLAADKEPLNQEPLIEQAIIQKDLVDKPSIDKPSMEKPLIEKPLAAKPLIKKALLEQSPTEDLPLKQQPSIKSRPEKGNETNAKQPDETTTEATSKKPTPSSRQSDLPIPLTGEPANTTAGSQESASKDNKYAKQPEPTLRESIAAKQAEASFEAEASHESNNSDSSPSDSKGSASGSSIKGNKKRPAANADEIKGEPLKADPLKTESRKGEPLKSEPVQDDPLTDEPLTGDPLTGKPLTSEPLAVK